MREELKDLIDDGPIEEDGDDSDVSDRSKKRKRSDDEFDDRLEDDDYDLIEENLGVKVDRVSLLLNSLKQKLTTILKTILLCSKIY